MLLLFGIGTTYRQLLAAFAGIPPDFGGGPERVILVTVIRITTVAPPSTGRRTAIGTGRRLADGPIGYHQPRGVEDVTEAFGKPS